MSATAYRGWLISHDNPPIPSRDFDWSATHPSYDGAEDADDNRAVYARTYDKLMTAIDDWFEENAVPTAHDVLLSIYQSGAALPQGQRIAAKSALGL